VTWPVGEAEIRALIGKGELERVSPNPKHADRLLSEARHHYHSALMLRDSDPTAAYQVAYSGYRKVALALLIEQGLRVPSRAGHVPAYDAVRAQFNGPHGSDAFKHPHIYRRQRHDAEYPDPDDPGTTQDDVDDIADVLDRAITAAQRVRDGRRLDGFR